MSAAASAFMQLSLFIPARADPKHERSCLLSEQSEHFILLPWKCASHPRGERETFLSRPQPNQTQKLSVWKPCLEHSNAHVCKEVCVPLCAWQVFNACNKPFFAHKPSLPLMTSLEAEVTSPSGLRDSFPPCEAPQGHSAPEPRV